MYGNKLKQSRVKYCNKCCPHPLKITPAVNERNPAVRNTSQPATANNPNVHQKVDGVWKYLAIKKQWIVSCNPCLLLKLDRHVRVNVNVVTAASCAKYLFKHATKGADRTKARTSGISREIDQYHQTQGIFQPRRKTGDFWVSVSLFLPFCPPPG